MEIAGCAFVRTKASCSRPCREIFIIHSQLIYCFEDIFETKFESEKNSNISFHRKTGDKAHASGETFFKSKG